MCRRNNDFNRHFIAEKKVLDRGMFQVFKHPDLYESREQNKRESFGYCFIHDPKSCSII